MSTVGAGSIPAPETRGSRVICYICAPCVPLIENCEDTWNRSEVLTALLSYIYNGAQGRNRTTDTVIFSHVLYQLSYLGVAGVLRGPGVIEGRRFDCPAAVAANRGSGLKLTSVNGWLFACFNLRASKELAWQI